MGHSGPAPQLLAKPSALLAWGCRLLGVLDILTWKHTVKARMFVWRRNVCSGLHSIHPKFSGHVGLHLRVWVAGKHCSLDTFFDTTFIFVFIFFLLSSERCVCRNYVRIKVQAQRKIKRKNEIGAQNHKIL